MHAPNTERRLHRRCVCGRLLGIELGGALHIKRGDVDAVIRGAVRLRCPRCQRETALETTHP